MSLRKPVKVSVPYTERQPSLTSESNKIRKPVSMNVSCDRLQTYTQSVPEYLFEPYRFSESEQTGKPTSKSVS